MPNYKSLTSRIQVSVHQLFLDPNNPRLIDQNNHNAPPVTDCSVEDEQDRLLNLFCDASADSEESFIDISDLKKSMGTVGFQPIDRIVVRKLDGEKNKYLVIEGNRRVATMKTLIDDDAKIQYGTGIAAKDEKKNKFKNVKDTFLDLPVELLEPWNEENIALILGLRHFGSVKDWPPYARAKHAYRRYMELELPNDSFFPLEKFEFLNKRSKKVQEELSVKTSEVKTCLKTYVVFKQLQDLDSNVSSLDYQLILSALKLRDFLNQNEATFLLDETNIVRLTSLLQFNIRNDNRKDSRLIIQGEKALRDFGKIVKYKAGQLPKDSPYNATVEEKAGQLILELLEGKIDEDKKPVLSVSSALERIQTISQQQHWVHLIQSFLDAQKDNLPIDQYAGIGNDKLMKDKLKHLVLMHCRAIQVDVSEMFG
jgi:hypothetical protein